jgi:hypothetical protein
MHGFSTRIEKREGDQIESRGGGGGTRGWDREKEREKEIGREGCRKKKRDPRRGKEIEETS